jgi:hypothetical protein
VCVCVAKPSGKAPLPQIEKKTPDSQSLESGVWSVGSGEHEPVPQVRHPISECASVIVKTGKRESDGLTSGRLLRLEVHPPSSLADLRLSAICQGDDGPMLGAAVPPNLGYSARTECSVWGTMVLRYLCFNFWRQEPTRTHGTRFDGSLARGISLLS